MYYAAPGLSRPFLFASSEPTDSNSSVKHYRWNPFYAFELFGQQMKQITSGHQCRDLPLAIQAGGDELPWIQEALSEYLAELKRPRSEGGLNAPKCSEG